MVDGQLDAAEAAAIEPKVAKLAAAGSVVRATVAHARLRGHA